MKKTILASAVLTVMGLGAAAAADLPARTYTKAPAMAPVQMYNWNAFYIGGHVGGAFPGENNLVGGSNDGTFMGGAQVGFDTQCNPNWVFGVEANYSWLDTQSSFANRNLGSVTGRLGYTWGGPTLLYVKGGYAWADSRFTNGFSGDGGRDGYTVGGGLEYLFTQNWSGKIEYQYYDFGNVTPLFNNVAVAGFTNDVHTVKAGLNYRFNLGSLGTGLGSGF